MRRVFAPMLFGALIALTGCGRGAESQPARPAQTAAQAPSAAPSSSPPDTVLIALGDSLPAGYRPGGTEIRESAYPALAAARMSPSPAVENLACSGATTSSMTQIDDCDYVKGTQLAQALAAIKTHRGSLAAVTVQIGGNDLLRCVDTDGVDAACVRAGLAQVNKNLPKILTELRAATGPGVPILVVGYYNPWLAASVVPSAPPGIEAASRGYDDLSAAIKKAAADTDTTYVDLRTAFRVSDTKPVTLAGRVMPANAAAVCRLTYVCTGLDIHLTDEGQAAVGRLVAKAAEATG